MFYVLVQEIQFMSYDVPTRIRFKLVMRMFQSNIQVINSYDTLSHGLSALLLTEMNLRSQRGKTHCDAIFYYTNEFITVKNTVRCAYVLLIIIGITKQAFSLMNF